MDLVQTVRKEGSRGGRGDFKWSDVQTSSHRENYLGHSLMAPTGRWAKGRDLTWYAKGDKDATDAEANARKEEIKRVKEAENDAMLRALGLPVPDRSNPNNEALGSRSDLDKALQDSSASEQQTAGGIGYGKGVDPSTGAAPNQNTERIEGNAEQQDKELAYALKEYKRRHRDDRSRSRNRKQDRSRSRDRDRKHRHWSRDRERRRRSRSRDRKPRRERSSERESSHRYRSRSPTRPRRDDHRRDRRDR